MPSNYGDTSIQNNEGPKGLRKRPATLLGTGGLSGCVHAIFEIVSIPVEYFPFSTRHKCIRVIPIISAS